MRSMRALPGAEAGPARFVSVAIVQPGDRVALSDAFDGSRRVLAGDPATVEARMPKVLGHFYPREDGDVSVRC